VHRSSYHHDPALAARLDQETIGHIPMTTSAPTSATAKIAAERKRRGLIFPDSWLTAGLRTEGEEA
jgi:hypothetical protein